MNALKAKIETQTTDMLFTVMATLEADMVTNANGSKNLPDETQRMVYYTTADVLIERLGIAAEFDAVFGDDEAFNGTTLEAILEAQALAA